MKIKKTLLAAALSAGLFSVTSANAALELTLYYDGDYRGVYDTDLNITWLRDANLAATNTFLPNPGINPDGSMSWHTAQYWILSMNATNYLGYNDWRLPTTFDIGNNGITGSFADGSLFNGTGDAGYNVTSSEMGHLFYTELGNLGYFNTSGNGPQPGWGLTNTGLFTNVQPYMYWSGTEYVPDTTKAWYFSTGYGLQDVYGKTQPTNMYAWAVRNGGAPISAVPEPEAYVMLLAGLGLLSFTARRRKHSA